MLPVSARVGEGCDTMIRVDAFEPVEIMNLIGQSCPATRANLNNAGFADYLWQDHAGDPVQVERKQWGEILSDLEGIEEQLRREFIMTPSMYLLIEGLVEPSPNGILGFKRNQMKPIWTPAHEWKNQPHFWSRVQAWLWSLDKAGITIVQTPTLGATATTLVAMYKQHQDPTHTVLNRYLKPRTSLLPQNNCVRFLMGVPGLGESRAKVLAEHFGSVGRLVNADPGEISSLPGFGDRLANKVLEYLWEV